MQRFARGVSFDEEPLPNLNSEAIDFRVASELFADVRRLSSRDLDTLRILTPYHGKRVPTIGGMILFGKARLDHFPDAWIQAGRFGGDDKAHIIDHVNLTAPLARAIEEAVAFVEKHMSLGAAIGRVKRVDRPAVPAAALREAIINAVAHADYAQSGAPIRVSIFDDRVEIENPGLLPFGLTLEELPQGISKLRNRVIGRIFQELGLVEQWGSGVQRILATCKGAGLPPPRWEEIGNRIRVTLYTNPAGPVLAEGHDDKILRLLKSGNGMATREVAAAIGLTTRAARTRLAGLVERGLVREVGTSPKDPKRKYFLAR